MHARAVAVAAAAAVLTMGCTTGSGALEPVPTTPTAPVVVQQGLQSYYEQDLQWRECGSGFECAQLRVPRDYRDPGTAGDFGLSVVRLRSGSDEPLGSLILNPGGPGASGVDYARAAGSVVSDQVRDAYDVVGFDPRGVAGSDPVECLSDAETDRLLALDPTPDDAAEVAALTAQTAAVGRQCFDRSPQVAPWMDTVSTARDLDILRAALGDDQLHYLGKSFGTAIGAVYAERFPQQVGRMVLDGAFPISLSSQQISRGQAVGFETALQRFVDDCLPRADCPLQSKGVAAGVGEIQRFLAELEEQPLPAADGKVLNEALGSAALLYHLYFPPQDWILLRAGLSAAFDGDGSLLLSMLHQRLRRDPATGAYGSNAQEAFYAVTCLDRPASSMAGIQEQADTWAADAPTFGPYLAWSDAVCAQWPVAATADPRPITARGSAPILVVSAEFDPATPYQWGVEMAQQFQNGVLVSHNADGHTSYRNGSTCIDDVVDAYLISGIVPEQDPRCGY